MQDIFREIQIIPGKCPPYIIFLLVTAFCKLPELRNDQVITSLSAAKRPHSIVDFLPSVQAQHHIIHLPVDEFLHLVI